MYAFIHFRKPPFHIRVKFQYPLYLQVVRKEMDSAAYQNSLKLIPVNINKLLPG